MAQANYISPLSLMAILRWLMVFLYGNKTQTTSVHCAATYLLLVQYSCTCECENHSQHMANLFQVWFLSSKLDFWGWCGVYSALKLLKKKTSRPFYWANFRCSDGVMTLVWKIRRDQGKLCWRLLDTLGITDEICKIWSIKIHTSRSAEHFPLGIFHLKDIWCHTCLQRFGLKSSITEAC